MPSNNSILIFDNVQLGYQSKPVLRNITCEIPKGSFTGIVGPNGAGKSTLLRAALGLIPAQSGKIARDKSQKFAYVSQLNESTQWPLTLREVVELGVRSRKFWGSITAEEQQAIDEALTKTSLSEIAEQLFNESSGGQKQRARLAQALAQKPDVLVLDEPTTGLDIQVERDFLALVRTLQQKEHLTILFVTHTIHIPQQFADQTLILGDGSVKLLSGGHSYA